MGILSWIVVGLIAGWLAGIVMKGRGYGLIGNIVIGIVGALLGGWLAGQFFGISNPINGINVTTVVVAFIGSILLIGILRIFSGNRRI